jgi:hypothetical protein
MYTLDTGDPIMNSSSEEELDDKVRRFEKAVRDLIDEGHGFVDHQAWLEAAAARAGVDLQEVLPTRH